jgi:hypothetical protein
VNKLQLILPFALSLLVKLLSITLLPKVMLTSLEDLVAPAGPPSYKAMFGNDQRVLIVNTVSNAALKATATLTSVVSIFNLFVILYPKPSSTHMIMLCVAVAFLVLLLVWLLPQTPQHLSVRGPFGIERATTITLMLCTLDGFGTIVSLFN